MAWIQKFYASKVQDRSQRQSLRRANARRCLLESLETRQLLAGDTVLFADSFETGEWAGKWVEDSQNDWFISTQRATDGSHSAELDGFASDATLTLATPVDLTSYDTATLTFDWLIENGFDSGEYLALDVYDGNSWQTDVRRLDGNVDTEDVWHSETVDLSAYASSNLLVRFRSLVSSSNEDADVDNVKIVGTQWGTPEISIGDAGSQEGDNSFRFIDTFINAGSGGLNEARGIDYGPDGNLYISRESFFTDPIQQGYVQRYDAATGAFIDVFATHPDMNGAKDVEFGPDGNLYVPNNFGNNVYRFDGYTGEFIDVFIPTGSGGLDTPRSLIFGPDGNGDGYEDAYITSAQTDSVLRYDGITGDFIDAFVPTASGGLNAPTALLFGPDGNLYVASGAHSDYYNSILRYDGSTGTFMDVFVTAGSGGLTLAPTAGVIFGQDANGDSYPDLYVSNGEIDEVLIFDGSNGDFLGTLIPAGSGGLDDPKGLLFDKDGNLLVISNGDDAVRRYGVSSQSVFTVNLSNPSNQTVTVEFATTAGTASPGSDYSGVSGTLVFEPGVTSRTIIVPTIDDSDVEPTENFVVDLSNATGGATIADSRGLGQIIDDDAARQVTISDASATEGDNTYHFVDEFVQPNGAFTIPPIDLVQDGPNGDFYATTGLATGQLSNIVRIDHLTGEVDNEFVPVGSAGLALAKEIAIQGNWIYVANKGTNEVLRFEKTTGAPDPAGAFVAAGDHGLSLPRGLVFDASGNLYVSSRATGDILTYDSSGLFLGVFASVDLGGNLPGANDMAFDASGDLLLVGGGQIVKLNGQTGVPTGFVISGYSGQGIEIGPEGDIYLSHATPENDNGGPPTGNILRFNSQSGALVSTLATPNNSEAWGLAFDSDANLYGAIYEPPGSLARYAPRSSNAFTVRLSSPSAVPVSVDFATAAGTANDGSDYSGVAGTLVFEPGVTSRTIIVPTIDDTDIESTENFFVNLSYPTGATILDGQGEGSILDNDQPNQSPLAVADSASARTDIEAIIDVLANDSDPDGDALSVVSVTSPSHGQVTINADNTVSYLSDPGYSGPDAFDYTISDGHGGTATGSVSIDVSAVTRIFVADISFQSRKGGRDWRVTVEIRDEYNQPVQGVLLRLTFGNIDATFTTDINGQIQTAWQTVSTGTTAEVYTAPEDPSPGDGWAWDQALYQLWGYTNGVEDRDGDGRADKTN